MSELHPAFVEDAWTAPADLVGTYRITELVRALGMAGMTELWARAEADPQWWYPAALDFLGAQWLRPFNAVCSDAEEPFRRWFVGGGTNLAWHCVTRWRASTNPAIVWESDGGDEVREISFAELDQQVRAAAAGFRRLGVGLGDVVAMHLPVVPEALVTMLAVASVGAIVAPAFSGYGPEALGERLRLGGARVLVTADGTYRRGKPVAMLPTALAAVEGASSVRAIVVLSRLGSPLPAAPDGRTMVTWSEHVAEDGEAGTEVLDADTPWLLMFTSGSTGRPKGAVHTHGGLGYSLMLDLGLSLDVRPGDRFTWPADMGWLAGPMAGLGPLTLGATAVLFEGVVDYPRPDRIWQLIERHGVTQYGLAPTSMRMLAAQGEALVEPFELSTLRVLATSGERCTIGAWRWLHRHVGRGWRPIINWTGGTEIGGPILTCYPNVATVAPRFSGPALGISADVVDEHGQSVVGVEGELVVRRSWPNMTKGLWNEPERYLESYWSRFPGLWVQGDRAIRLADGTWDVPGRSDDVFKVAGKRIGPTEYEALACEVPGVVSAAAIGLPHATKGEVAVVVVQTDVRAGDALLPQQVSDRIAASFGKPMRPEAVLVVAALPLTRSGKVHRRVLRAWITDADPGDTSTLDNPEVGPAVRDAGAGLRDRLGDVSPR